MVTIVNSHRARHWETHFTDVKLFNANDTHKQIHSPSHFTDNKSEESSLILETGNWSLNTSNLPRAPPLQDRAAADTWLGRGQDAVWILFSSTLCLTIFINAYYSHAGDRIVWKYLIYKRKPPWRRILSLESRFFPSPQGLLLSLSFTWKPSKCLSSPSNPTCGNWPPGLSQSDSSALNASRAPWT